MIAPFSDQWGRALGHVDQKELDAATNSDGVWITSRVTTDADAMPDEPNVILSVVTEDAALGEWQALGEWHLPVLDIDFPARLVESSTSGHYHLYLDGAPVAHETYMELLDVLARCGIIGPGYARTSIERGYTVVRRPGVRKPDANGYKPRHLGERYTYEALSTIDPLDPLSTTPAF